MEEETVEETETAILNLQRTLSYECGIGRSHLEDIYDIPFKSENDVT